MPVQPSVLEPAVQQAMERGTKTLRQVLSRAGKKEVAHLQTTTDGVAFLTKAAILAIEAIDLPPNSAERQLHEARMRGVKRIAELRKAAAPLLETGEACDLLGVSRETIRKKVDRKQLLAIPKGDDRVFPAFQFEDGVILTGLAEVLKALPTASPYVVLSFLLSKQPELNNRSAVDLLKRGEIKPVLKVAARFLDHGN